MLNFFILFFYFSKITLADESPLIVTPPKGVRNYAGTLQGQRKISRKEIEATVAQSVVDLLKQQPELFISSNGAFGKASAISLRGTSNRHTLIMIDGVRVTDLTSIEGGSRLELLDLSDVESIEIIKGASSVLYGSEAIGGVIKINTFRPQIKRIRVKGDLGSFDNKSIYLGQSQSIKNFDYKASVFLRDVEGISAFDNSTSENFERDGLRNFRGNTKLGWAISPKDQVDLDLSFESSEIEFDDSTADNSLNESDYKTLRGSFIYEGERGRLFNPKVITTFQKIDREVRTINSFGNSRSIYDGNFLEGELSNFSKLGNRATIISGINYEIEKADSLGGLNDTKRTRERNALFLNLLADINSFLLELGLRQNRSQFYDSSTLYRLAIEKKILGWEIKASQGTGFKAPSLYQTFSSFGNLQLKPEEGKTQDFSLGKSFADFQFDITYFTVDISNFIDYDTTTNRYFNLGNLKNKGVEANLQFFLGQLDFSFGSTFSNPKSGNSYASRRPRRKFDGRINYKFNEMFEGGVQATYSGERNDTDGSRLPSFLQANAQMGIGIDQWKTSLFFNNILDKEYQEIRNYGVPGRNFLISLSREWL